MFNHANILVTGGTGSLGYELIKRLLSEHPNKIIIYSRNESMQNAMRNTIEDPRLHFIIGDIRDKEALVKACQGIDYIFHLAALKHVHICEEQPIEALKTNVLGSQNVIEAAIQNKVRKVIYMSTDKAANPTNFYGMTKAIGERLMIIANSDNSETKIICVRGGNILGTSGSVLHLFMNQVQQNSNLGITDKKMTRFFLSSQNIVNLLLKAAKEGRGGETFVMIMPSCKIIDLAEVLIDASGKKNLLIEEIGVRPGEKLHELLISKYESKNAFIYDNEYFVVIPSIHISGLKQFYSAYPAAEVKTYSSNENCMTKEEIRRMLDESGFLI